MIIGIMLGAAYQEQGLYSLAERQFQKLAELYPNFPNTQRSLAELYTFNTGQFDKAVMAMQKALELDRGNTVSWMFLAAVYLQLGDFESAEAARRQLEEIDSQHWSLGWTDMIIASAQKNPAALNEAINWLLPKIQSFPNFAPISSYHVLSLGDKDRAREIFLSTNPNWLDKGKWRDMISVNAANACVFSWLLLSTGEQPLGKQLLEDTTHYLEIELAAVNEHVDGQLPEICYLAAGDKEKALASIETQLQHNHLFGWNFIHKMPMYDLIRNEPRYLAAFQERERRIAVQREALESGVGL
jgi:tetratricopeptide (TPR) repeat protein